MARSNGDNPTQAKLIKGGLIAAILCAIIIGLGLSQSADYERQADNKRAEYAEYIGEKVAQDCIRIPHIERLRCVNEAFEAKRDYEADQYDLEAQRQSALWAYIMGAAAVIGVALSAIGVWLVKTTFDETRKANDLSAKFQRARIKVTLKIVDNVDFTYIVGIEAENIGASVATDVYVRFGIFNEPPDSPMVTDRQSYKHTIKQGDKIPVSATQPTINRFDEAFFAGYAIYNTVFGGPHYSYFCLRLSIVPNRLGIVRPSRAGIPETPSHWPTDT
jgi:hypothetical protein